MTLSELNQELPDQEHLRARREQAELFFNQTFLPAIRESREIKEAEFNLLLGEFQQRNPSLGNDFSRSLVWTVAQKRVMENDRALEQNIPLEEQDPDARIVEEGYELLTKWETI